MMTAACSVLSPPRPECPICFLVLPRDNSGSKYWQCCGKKICNGCYWANEKARLEAILRCIRKKQPQLEDSCPFCRAPVAGDDDKNLACLQTRMELNDAEAFLVMADNYEGGNLGLPKDECKTVDYFMKAAELGSMHAYSRLAYFYLTGTGVPTDEAMGKEYTKMAARKGEVNFQHNLGNIAYKNGNCDLAVKHFGVPLL